MGENYFKKQENALGKIMLSIKLKIISHHTIKMLLNNPINDNITLILILSINNVLN